MAAITSLNQFLKCLLSVAPTNTRYITECIITGESISRMQNRLIKIQFREIQNRKKKKALKLQSMRDQTTTFRRDYLLILLGHMYPINKYDQYSACTLSSPWFRIVNWLSVRCCQIQR